MWYYAELFRLQIHSLNVFCFAVKGEVINAIDGANENYGMGTCLKMDYNISTSRASFKMVWAYGS